MWREAEKKIRWERTCLPDAEPVGEVGCVGEGRAETDHAYGVLRAHGNVTQAADNGLQDGAAGESGRREERAS